MFVHWSQSNDWELTSQIPQRYKNAGKTKKCLDQKDIAHMDDLDRMTFFFFFLKCKVEGFPKGKAKRHS